MNNDRRTLMDKKGRMDGCWQTSNKCSRTSDGTMTNIGRNYDGHRMELWRTSDGFMTNIGWNFDGRWMELWQIVTNEIVTYGNAQNCDGRWRKKLWWTTTDDHCNGQQTIMDGRRQQITNGNGWWRCCRANYVCELWSDGVQKRRKNFFLLLLIRRYTWLQQLQESLRLPPPLPVSLHKRKSVCYLFF
jgi:hypothetical protein